MHEREDKEFYSAEELRLWLGLGRTKVFELLSAPENGIPNYRIGRKIVIRKRDVEDWLEEHRYKSGHG